MFATGGLPIDLGGDGPTPNDPGDADTGPNGLANSPSIELAAQAADLRASASCSAFQTSNT